MAWFGTSPAQKRFVHGVQTGAPPEALAEMLDGMDPRERVGAATAVKSGLVGRLYDLVRGGSPLRLVDIVPSSTPAGATVTFEGRNSLPAFSRFQKRFTRTADGLVFGYNHQPLRAAGALTGPGYFRVVEADEQHPGELLFDYTQPPPFEPAGWPAYRPNEAGASRFVFKDLNDYVRKVARGVVVGAAFRHGKDQDAYFVLVSPSPR
ncbi:MAG: hypothetical protein ACOC1F_14670 [Myxococcota bacterium]